MRLIAFSRAPALVAAFDRGFFAAEGLEVAFTRATSSRAQLDALLAGEYDIAHTAADNVIARVDAGADLRIVLVVDHGADHRLVGAPAIHTLADVAGRRLGVDSPGSGHALLAYVLLAEAGVARDRYAAVPVGSTPERYAALIAGRVDAAMLSSPHDEPAVAAGCHVLADAAARFPEHPGLTVAVRGEWASAHRADVEAYCRALIAGAHAAGDPTRRDERERIGPVLTIEQMARTVASACEVRRAAGLATGPFDVARYFDPSYARRSIAH